MSGFSSALNEHEIESLLAFLFEEEDRQLVVSETDKTADDKIKYFNISGYTTWIDQSGNPALQPPWGTLNALNLSTGEYEWQIPLGNDPKLQEDATPLAGLEGKAGPVVTGGGLIFISGAMDLQLCAIDKATGKILWQTTLPSIANATACTYKADGKQFVAL